MNTLALTTIVFVASTLQAATGFGFAILATPFLLLLFDAHNAIQLNIILSLLISLIMIYNVHNEINIKILGRLIRGGLIGIIPGLLLFVFLDVRPLKLLVSILILASTSLLIAKIKFKQNNLIELFTGMFSGSLTTSIGMPGPPLMIYFAGAEVDKTTMRATTIAYFIFVNFITLLLQLIVNHNSSVLWKSTLWSIPFVVLGILLGQWVFARLNQRLLHRIIYLLLTITGLYLLLTTI